MTQQPPGAGAALPASRPPHWRLPPGVPRGLWEYAHAPHIAEDYDEYFLQNQLFEFDEEVLARHFTKPGLVADLGCGTGRALMPLVRRRHRGLAVDLSPHMLRIVGEKAAEEGLSIHCVLANLVELDCLRTDSVDYAMCLFSTLGMIRGRANRRRMLGHVRRILKPGGVFCLHVHNVWFNLFDPAGRAWLAWHVLTLPFRRGVELGDKFYPYRSIPNMFLHTFTRGELTRELRRAGFRIRELIPLAVHRQRPLRRPWLFGRLRANGWIAACE